MGKMVGIDLGTTNTVVAIIDGPRPRVLDSQEGKPQIRSAVSLKKRKGRKGEAGTEEILVGDAAVDNWGMAPKDTVLSVKRLMGRGVTDPEVQRIRQRATYAVVEPKEGTKDSVRVVIGGRQYSPIEVSAMILQKVKETAEFRLGEPVTHAVITVPAYFSQIQRDATRKAGLKAGLKVIKVLDEPTAAAVAFGVESPDEKPRTLVVYDLGGGTFDVSVLMMAGNVFAPLNLEGDMWLGGDDFDQKIIDHALRHIKNEYDLDPSQDGRFMAELRKAAQTVKERLTAANSADLLITGLLRDDDDNLLDVDLEITRKEFERMIVPLVGRYRECACGAANLREDTRCAQCGQPLRGPERVGKSLQLVHDAIQNASLTADQVDYVLMAGNSTIVPLVQREIEAEFGSEKVLRTIHPKHCVALGAAITARWVGDRVICQAPDPADPKRECGHVNDTDAQACANCGAKLDSNIDDVSGESAPAPPTGIAPYSYGTQTAGDKYNVFIQKGDPYPTEDPKPQTFYTRIPNQRIVSIPVYGGDHFEKASANELQGQALALLPAALPQKTPIRIQLVLDGDGVFQVEAWLGDGTRLNPWVVAGESDAKAIENLEQLNQRLVDPATRQRLPKVVAAAERERDRVYVRLQRHEFDEALHDIVEINHGLDNPLPDDEDLREKAANLIRFAEFVMSQYGELMTDPNQTYQLTRVVEATRKALDANDPRNLQAQVNALDKATDAIPDVIRLFLGIRSAILSRIQPRDPRKAAGLLREVEEIENGLKRQDFQALGKLNGLAERIGQAIQEVVPGGARCSQGHPTQGKRYCPTCNEDTWGLGHL
ncbi:MAG: Hsp70 family protein [Candidatus Contendobacter sp.]|nr:Hsp70 family protein [Candidatus Contendobacter sp.]MDS4060685.1 Hsp70 family protein [Candidatus Contendobacter sp.]